MPKNNEAKWDSYFSIPNQHLESYFGRVRTGNPDVYETPFSKKHGGRQKILEQWKPIVDKLSERWPSLLEYENDLAKKVGPMSVMRPLDERMSDIDSYYDLILHKSKPISSSAVSAVIREWSRARGLQLRSQERTVELMKKSTNSGSPFFAKRRAVTDKTVPCEICRHHSEFLQILSMADYLSCAVLGWRGQEGGPEPNDVKQRVVWMFPYAVNIAELQFYQPAIEAAQRFNLVPAWVSMEAVDKEITALFDTKAKNDLIVCTDFSKFDQHFNEDMQNAAKSIITRILNSSSSSRNWIEQVFPVKYAIPLAYDYGKIRRGLHGMGSGSGGTNFDETLTHRALQYEVAQKHGARLNPHSMCLGDDGILTYPGITVDDVVESYSSHGQECNTEKQYASTTDCTYLRRWHHVDYRVDGVCVGVYSTYRALGRLMYQERYYDPEDWGPKQVALRQLSIIENCKYHPLREEFAQFCMKRDKYRLGIDIPGFLDNIEREAEKAIEVMPDFLGYTKSLQSGNPASGISEWWIVKYLKSVR